MLQPITCFFFAFLRSVISITNIQITQSDVVLKVKIHAARRVRNLDHTRIMMIRHWTKAKCASFICFFQPTASRHDLHMLEHARDSWPNALRVFHLNQSALALAWVCIPILPFNLGGNTTSVMDRHSQDSHVEPIFSTNGVEPCIRLHSRIWTHHSGCISTFKVEIHSARCHALPQAYSSQSASWRSFIGWRNDKRDDSSMLEVAHDTVLTVFSPYESSTVKSRSQKKLTGISCEHYVYGIGLN